MEPGKQPHLRQRALVLLVLLALLGGWIFAIPQPAAAQTGSPGSPEAFAIPNLTLGPAFKVMKAPAFWMNVYGTGMTRAMRVYWGTTLLTTRYVSMTRLQARVPASLLVTPGYYTIQVIDPADPATVLGQQTFTVRYPAPKITALVQPRVKVYAPAYTLSIIGSGFVSGVTELHWKGGTAPVPYTFVNKTHLKLAVTPDMLGDQAGLIEVRVTNPAPGGGTSARNLQLRNPVPVLSTAALLINNGTYSLSILGNNFVPGSVVRFNGAALVNVNVSRQGITAIVTADQFNAANGKANVRVFNAAPGGGYSRTVVTRWTPPIASGKYILTGWNDLGMHCYNRDFSNLAVLPPYNTLVAQVIRVSDPPQLVTKGITVEYSFPNNTYSVGKSNFWDYAQALFGLPQPLPANIGLPTLSGLSSGRGLAGQMSVEGDHFIADGIPLTEYQDSPATVSYPYQKAQLVAKETATGIVLATLTVVAPVSTEMRCDTCHSDGQRTRNDTTPISMGKVEINILALHDDREGTTLLTSQPVLCAACHPTKALNSPGKPGILPLSNAMHGMHAGKVPDTLDGCYSCHPGQQTRCLRDVMNQEEGMTCISCHGGLAKVATNSNPWLNEPKCSTCHGVTQNAALYRMSTGHGGMYCAACHDSPHAIAPSREANDWIKFQQLTGNANAKGPLGQCTVCHKTQPSGSIHPGAGN